jgi:DNA invertase Pin-like site-specific DNA recombinase
LYLHQQGVNATTPAGKAMFQMLGVFAEFERSMIQERVRSGLSRARAAAAAKGEVFVTGRPKVAQDTEQRIRELRATGMGLIKIGKTVGCGTSAVQRVVATAA